MSSGPKARAWLAHGAAVGSGARGIQALTRSRLGQTLHVLALQIALRLDLRSEFQRSLPNLCVAFALLRTTGELDIQSEWFSRSGCGPGVVGQLDFFLALHRLYVGGSTTEG